MRDAGCGDVRDTEYGMRGQSCGAAAASSGCPGSGTAPAQPRPLRGCCGSARLRAARGVSRGCGDSSPAPPQLRAGSPGGFVPRFALFNSIGGALAVAGSLGMACWGEMMRVWLPAAVGALQSEQRGAEAERGRSNPARSGTIAGIYFDTSLLFISILFRVLRFPTIGTLAPCHEGILCFPCSAPASPMDPELPISGASAGAGSVHSTQTPNPTRTFRFGSCSAILCLDLIIPPAPTPTFIRVLYFCLDPTVVHKPPIFSFSGTRLLLVGAPGWAEISRLISSTSQLGSRCLYCFLLLSRKSPGYKAFYPRAFLMIQQAAVKCCMRRFR